MILRFPLLLSVGLFLSLLASCFINIILEWIGMLFGWWNEPGAGHSAAMLRYEVQLLNNDFKDVIGIDSLPILVDKIHWLLFKWNGVDYRDNVLTVFAGVGIWTTASQQSMSSRFSLYGSAYSYSHFRYFLPSG